MLRGAALIDALCKNAELQSSQLKDLRQQLEQTEDDHEATSVRFATKSLLEITIRM